MHAWVTHARMEEPVRKKMEKQFAGAKGNSLVRRVQVAEYIR